MSTFKLAVCQLDVGEDKNANISNAKTQIATAAKNGAEVVVLGECFNCPYSTAVFADYAETIPGGETTAMLQAAAKEHGIYLIGGSYPERGDDGAIYNTSVSFNPNGDIAAKHRKVHLFDIDIPGGITFKESETLSAGNQMSILETKWGNFGVAICYDIRFPELALLMSLKHDCKVLLYPGAFNMTTGPAHWELLGRARAVDTQTYTVLASPARKPGASYQAWGHSSIFSPWGDVVSTTEHEPTIVYADVNLGKVAEIRRNIPVRQQRRHDVYTLKQTE